MRHVRTTVDLSFSDLIQRSIGRPGRMIALRDFVDYISKKEGVWVATRTEIAEAFKAKHPYKKGQ